MPKDNTPRPISKAALDSIQEATQEAAAGNEADGQVTGADAAEAATGTEPMFAADALAAAEALLAEGDGLPDPSAGNVSVDDIIAAFGAATLRVQKAEQLVFQQQNEIQRLRATLKNVIAASKKLKK